MILRGAYSACVAEDGLHARTEITFENVEVVSRLFWSNRLKCRSIFPKEYSGMKTIFLIMGNLLRKNALVVYSKRRVEVMK